MKRITKLLVTGTGMLVLAGSVAGAALASGSTPKAPKSETTSTVDTDSIQLQQGDQTAPDTLTTSDSVSGQGGQGQGEGQAGGENSSQSDGPGGHEDPPGDVNHQFNGEE